MIPLLSDHQRTQKNVNKILFEWCNGIKEGDKENDKEPCYQQDINCNHSSSASLALD